MRWQCGSRAANECMLVTNEPLLQAAAPLLDHQVGRAFPGEIDDVPE